LFFFHGEDDFKNHEKSVIAGWPLVNVYITSYGKNHHFSWENQRFRLGHFQTSALLMDVTPWMSWDPMHDTLPCLAFRRASHPCFGAPWMYGGKLDSYVSYVSKI
jgi:hypothetical protein